jgi:xylulokinase
MHKYILGIDLGTSGCKASLFDLDLQLVCSAKVDYATSYPENGYAEQDATQWWDALIRSTREILGKSGINPAKIEGVGIDSMSPVVLPVDENGIPLRPALIWMDRRSTKQVNRLHYDNRKAIVKINGNNIDPSFMAPKMLWIKENEPSVYKKTNLFLHANGYLVYRLTGEFSMDISQSGLSLLCDTKKGEWSNDLINIWTIDKEKLPQLHKCFDVIGKISADASAQTGLVQGTPVVAGSMDNVAAALGSGVCNAGEVYISAGTVTNSGVCIDQPLYNDLLHIYHHIIPGMWLIVGGVDYGGAGLKWFKEILSEPDYSHISDLASGSKFNEDPLIFLPYMVGQRAPLWKNNTRGIIFGINPATTKQNLIRMFMEGSAFGTRKVLGSLNNLDISIKNIKMTGGSTNDKTWVQIFSNILNRPIDVPGEADVASLGSAMTVLYGLGICNNFTEISEKVKIRESYLPQADTLKYYDDMFRLFTLLYENAASSYDLLSNIVKNHGSKQ